MSRKKVHTICPQSTQNAACPQVCRILAVQSAFHTLRFGACFLLLAFLLFFVSACGSTDASDSSEKDAAMPDLKEAMLAADTTLPEMVNVSGSDGQAELNFSYLSDLSYDLVDDYFYAYAKEGTAEEIAVVKLKDKNDAASMMDSLHEHIKLRQGTFQEYSPEQVEMTEKAVVTREGSYIALIISKKCGMVQKAFQAEFE